MEMTQLQHEGAMATLTPLENLTPTMRAPVVASPAIRSSPATPLAAVGTPHDIPVDTVMLDGDDDEDDDDSDYAVDENVGDDMLGMESSLAKEQRKFRSKAWREFVPIFAGTEVTKGQCKHCNALIGARRGVGTSALGKHLRRCKARMRVRGIVSKLNAAVMSPDGVRLRDWNFDEDVSRKELVRMIVLHELPFSIVGYDGFQRFVSSLNPAFNMLSRKTVRKDILKSFEEHKKALKEVFGSSKSRLSLTMDLWTSNQSLGYMCVTCHFIDAEWKLQKRIINFSVLETPHTGVAMYNTIMTAIQDWNCENKIFAITLDNASSNGAMAKLLKENLLLKGMLVGKGKLLHQRCTGHILNLIVQAGLNFLNPIVSKIRESVKFI